VYAALKPELDAFAALRQVARGYCPDCGRGDAAPTVDDWEQQKQRADTAEKQRDEQAAEVERLADWVRAVSKRAKTAEADRDRWHDELAVNEKDRVAAIQRADRADEAARLALEQRQQMAAERHTWQERGDRAEAALTRARDACDQLRRAAVLADGQPHTDRERGIVHAIDRIHTALDTPEPTP
jgi:hypothetical protein